MSSKFYEHQCVGGREKHGRRRATDGKKAPLNVLSAIFAPI